MISVDSEPIIIPVVLPQTGDPSTSGRVRNLPVSPQVIPTWLEKRGGGQYAVKGVYAEKGYIKLEDLYKAEGDDAGWAKYQRYLVAWKAGTARISFPFESLPQEVQRRQSGVLVDLEFGGEFTPAKPTTGEPHPLPAPKKSKGGHQESL